MTKLKKQRKRSGLTLREVGERIGVTPQTVHDLETKGIKSAKAAQRYAKALNCNPLDIIEL